MGRFLIPRNMLTFAGITREAVVVGMGNKIEIWNPGKFEEYLIKDPDEFSQLAQKYLDN